MKSKLEQFNNHVTTYDVISVVIYSFSDVLEPNLIMFT